MTGYPPAKADPNYLAAVLEEISGSLRDLGNVFYPRDDSPIYRLAVALECISEGQRGPGPFLRLGDVVLNLTQIAAVTIHGGGPGHFDPITGCEIPEGRHVCSVKLSGDPVGHLYRFRDANAERLLAALDRWSVQP